MAMKSRYYVKVKRLISLRVNACKRVAATRLMFLTGLAVLGIGYGSLSPVQAAVLDTSRINCMVAMLLSLTEGDFGALIAVVAGIAFLVSSAMGAYRAAVSLLVVIIGAFTLRSFVVIFFNITPENADTCKIASSPGNQTVAGAGGVGNPSPVGGIDLGQIPPDYLPPGFDRPLPPIVPTPTLPPGMLPGPGGGFGGTPTPLPGGVTGPAVPPNLMPPQFAGTGGAPTPLPGGVTPVPLPFPPAVPPNLMPPSFAGTGGGTSAPLPGSGGATTTPPSIFDQ